MSAREPFAVGDYLAFPYSPWVGNDAKNATILAACTARPERLLVSRNVASLDVAVASILNDPRNAVWEVWHAGSLCGILLLDHIVERVDARLHFVFFDDALAPKVDVLREFVRRCFADLGLERLSLEVPEYMTTLTSFARRRLGFRAEGAAQRGAARRERAYFDGAVWHDTLLLRKLRSEDA